MVRFFARPRPRIPPESSGRPRDPPCPTGRREAARGRSQLRGRLKPASRPPRCRSSAASPPSASKPAAGARTAPHPLAPLLVLQADDADGGRTAPRENGGLDLGRVDVLAACHDPVGATTDDLEPAVLADGAQVARVEPPARLERTFERRARFHAEVPIEQSAAPDLDASDGPARPGGLGRPRHADLHPRQRLPHATGGLPRPAPSRPGNRPRSGRRSRTRGQPRTLARSSKAHGAAAPPTRTALRLAGGRLRACNRRASIVGTTDSNVTRSRSTTRSVSRASKLPAARRPPTTTARRACRQRTTIIRPPT